MPFREVRKSIFVQGDQLRILRACALSRNAAPADERAANSRGRASAYEAASATAFDDMMAATLGTLSACSDLRSHPLASQDSGMRNSE